MITTRAVPALPAHHRRAAQSSVTLQDFADPLEGTHTLFVGAGTVIAFVDFSHMGGRDIRVSPDRTAVTVRLPAPQLAPAALDVRHSYVFAQQQGLLNRIGNFFSGNPNSQQQVYVLAQQKIQAAASHS